MQILIAALLISAQNAPLKVAKLVIDPPALALQVPGEGRRVLVTGVTRDGERIDLTSAARLQPQSDAVTVDKGGYVYPAKEGNARVLISAGGQKAELPVTISALNKPRTLSFIRDVTPIVNKIGCTSGICHGAAKGKNGFKL